jgi:DNA-binding NtrC family response regulator
MSQYSVLLVDDELDNLCSTKELLQRWNYDVDAVCSGAEALERIRSSTKEYAVAVLDYKMPEMTGSQTAVKIRELNKEIILLIYSAYPSVESLMASIQAKALNFIKKDEKINLLRASLTEACEVFEQVRTAKPPISKDEATSLIASINMAGVSPSLAEVAKKIHRYAPFIAPVLILGETGVGKEIVARALHKEKPEKFFVVNCAGFQDSALVESELFGYEKGAFTGATSRKDGILTAAAGGTVYFDELHFLDLKTQGKLLRAIREKRIRRVGAQKEEEVNFRAVASTWPDIEEKVKKGTFLPDLYYRLNGLTIKIPPLRERPEDIEPLVLHFCQKHFKMTGVSKSFLKRTIRILEKQDWPGNVGQLAGFITAQVLDTSSETIDECHLDPSFQLATSREHHNSFAQLELKQEKEKKKLIRNVLESTCSVNHAAERLGMKPSSLHTLITRLGMRNGLQELAK